MKRLSLLVAILLIATIGGVYATWNYAGVKTNIGIQENQTIVLEQAETNGQAGTYTLTHNVKTISIAPNNQEEKIATLVRTFTNEDDTQVKINLTFKPAVNAGDEIETNAITSYVYFGTERALTWGNEGKDIFKFNYGKGSPITIGTANSSETYKWSDDDQDGIFNCVLTFNFEELVALNQTIELPTIDDYEDFLAAVGNSHTIQLHLHLSNIKPTVPTV